MIERLACSAVLALMLTACGLKGELYLPDSEPPADQPPAPATTEAPKDERDAAETETP